MLMTHHTDIDLRTWRWPHFKPSELACRCGGKYCAGSYWHDETFLNALEGLRARVGRALVITSGHRCREWNREVGGAIHSRHLQVAVDISLTGHDRFAVLEAAKAEGFTGIGLATSFIHLDRRERPAQWYYKRSKQAWRT